MGDIQKPVRGTPPSELSSSLRGVLKSPLKVAEEGEGGGTPPSFWTGFLESGSDLRRCLRKPVTKLVHNLSETRPHRTGFANFWLLKCLQ